MYSINQAKCQQYKFHTKISHGYRRSSLKLVSIFSKHLTRRLIYNSSHRLLLCLLLNNRSSHHWSLFLLSKYRTKRNSTNNRRWKFNEFIPPNWSDIQSLLINTSFFFNRKIRTAALTNQTADNLLIFLTWMYERTYLKPHWWNIKIQWLVVNFGESYGFVSTSQKQAYLFSIYQFYQSTHNESKDTF
jgi:hypothetical protein